MRQHTPQGKENGDHQSASRSCPITEKSHSFNKLTKLSSLASHCLKPNSNNPVRKSVMPQCKLAYNSPQSAVNRKLTNIKSRMLQESTMFKHRYKRMQGDPDHRRPPSNTSLTESDSHVCAFINTGSRNAGSSTACSFLKSSYCSLSNDKN